MSRKKKIEVYIDGYSLYHAIDDLAKPYLKWVDLWKLSACFVPSSTHTLTSVYYFSAIAKWRRSSARRHRIYINALEAKKVQITLGEFKERRESCKRCKYSWKRHEEKRTDANIAAALMAGALRNRYDEAFLISQDTDFSTVVDAIVRYSRKPIKLVLPPKTVHIQSLIDAASSKAKITEAHLERCQLDELIIDTKTGQSIERPQEWMKV